MESKMTDLSLKKRKRIEEIDYLRGFAILAVVAIHSSGHFTETSNVNLLLTINVIIDIFLYFAVPLFIFISGFVLYIKYKGLFSKKLFLQKRAKSILPPYIIFSILYTLYDITIAINGNSSFPSIMKITFNFLIASSYYHLWYFALIIQFYIFYPYIIKTYDKFTSNHRTFYFMFSALIIQELWLIVKEIILNYFNSNTYFNSITYFNTILDLLLKRVFFSHIFYFVLGIYVCQNYEYIVDKIFNAKKLIISIIVILTGAMSVLWINGIAKYGGYHSIPKIYFLVPDLLGPVYFPLIFSILFIISWNFTNTGNKFSTYSKTISLIGKYSLGIYLIHALFISIFVSLIFPQFNGELNYLIFSPALFILTILSSYYSVYLISYLPYSEIIIGTKNKN